MKKETKTTSLKEEVSSAFYIENPSLMKKWHSVLRDDRGLMRTTSLIFEAKREADPQEHLTPIFSLKDHDHVVDGVTYISLRRIYFSYDHVPGFEYQFAMDVFGSWEHWVKLTKSSIRHEFEAWREELHIRLKAEAIRSMIEASREKDAKGVSAAKYLADKGYIEGRKAGRPSTEEVERERKQQAAVRDSLTADMERLNLTVAK